MIPVTQTTFGERKGNCFAACVASVLELPLEEVPNFCCENWDGEWYQAFKGWLRARGLDAICYAVLDGGDEARAQIFRIACELRGVPWIGSGPNPSGVLHSTVWLGDALVHDPNPSQAGITRLDDMVLIVSERPVAR